MTVLDRARAIAEEVFFPAAMAVDGAEQVPAAHLDLLATEGFYGLAAPRPAGGLGLSGTAEAARVVEVLATGCLATTFVWLQHHGAVRGVAGSETPGLRDVWYGPLCRGDRRAGVAQAALRAGPAAVRARPVDGGYLLSGEAPWVTGWGRVDVLHTAARDPSDTVLWLLLDAVAGPTLSVEPLRLVAVNASRTVLVRFADHFVPADRLVTAQPYEGSQPNAPESLRANGSLALGVAGRCALLLGDADLESDVDSARKALDAALDGPADAMPRARAAASALAVRAAALLTVGTGARAVLAGEHAQRLAREAAFLLVFGGRPAIRSELQALLRAW
ncbi:MAG TPA: acyl-CoA dehydrogenase family protein [Rugosimonospora sp.]|nr:acyl-CoA dehydrogenase family protein [Rugosimonospora sp.]